MGPMPNNRALLRWMPAVFVLIWATGFIVARYGMPYAPPFSFLMLRYAASVACFLLWIAIARVAWPRAGLWRRCTCKPAQNERKHIGKAKITRPVNGNTSE